MENNLVKSWLLNSMMNEIGENFLLYETAAEIWEAAKEAYSHVENTSELFEIEYILHDQRQGDLTVTQYFNILNRYWQQLDMFNEHKWKCSDDRLYYKKIIEEARLYKFLIGLNKNLDDVRGRILSKRPLSSLREAFADVRREESRKKVMMGSQATTPAMDSSALTARGQQAHNSNNQQKKERPICDHCSKPGHTRDTCWDIHGKPANWKSKNQIGQNRTPKVVEGEAEEATKLGLTSDQFELFQKFQKLLKQTENGSTNPTKSMTAMAHVEPVLGEDDWQC